MSDNNANQKQESGKIKKAFEANLRKLTALLSGESYFKPAKVGPGGSLTEAVALLAKEEKEALLKKFVEEARKLIGEKRTFDKFVAQQKKELDKKVEAEQKKFNESSKALFALIADIGSIEKEYYATLSNASQGKPNEPVVEEKTEEDDDNNEE